MAVSTKDVLCIHGQEGWYTLNGSGVHATVHAHVDIRGDVRMSMSKEAVYQVGCTQSRARNMTERPDSNADNYKETQMTQHKCISVVWDKSSPT